MAEHRCRILEAARTLFEQHGVDAVSMHQIACEAHVGQGTLYRHFAHKGLLCMTLLNESIEHFQHKMLTYFEQSASTVPVLEQVRFFLRQLAIISEEHEPLLGTVMASCCGDHRSYPFTAPFPTWMRQVLSVLLHQAVEQGELAPLDIEYAVHAILAPLDPNLNHYLHVELGYDRERRLAGLEHLLFYGLRSPEST